LYFLNYIIYASNLSPSSKFLKNLLLANKIHTHL